MSGIKQEDKFRIHCPCESPMNIVISRHKKERAFSITDERSNRSKKLSLSSKILGFLSRVCYVTTKYDEIGYTKILHTVSKVIMQDSEEGTPLRRGPDIPVKIGEVPPDERLVCHVLLRLGESQI